MTEETSYLTTAEVAALVRVDASTVRRWAIAGLLPHKALPGGHYRFEKSDVEKLIAAERAA